MEVLAGELGAGGCNEVLRLFGGLWVTMDTGGGQRWLVAFDL